MGPPWTMAPRWALWRRPPSSRCRMVGRSASLIAPLRDALYRTTYCRHVSPARPIRAAREGPPPRRRSGGHRTRSLLERGCAMAREPVDLRTPGSRGLWVDRSPARMLSSPDPSTGDPPRRAARQGHLWARHEDAASAALPTHAAPDLAMPQGWSCVPAETTHALGRRFSQMVVRVLH